MTAQRSGIIAGGNWIADRVKLIDSWPPQDALASILTESASNGGSPYNILKDLARLGAEFPLEAIGLVGDDETGRSILTDCREHRIDTKQLRSTASARTSYTDVMTVQTTGRRTFFHQRGANALLDVEHFDFSATKARWFHLGYLLLLDRLDTFDAKGVPRTAAVLGAAREAGLKTSVDLVSENSDRFTRVVRPVLPKVDVLFANDFEAEKLTGVTLRQGGTLLRAAVEQAARLLIEAGVRDWVVLHFPEAAYARSALGGTCWQPSLRIPPENIKGTSGAGDAFAAGVLYGLHAHDPISACLQLGVSAAAASLAHASCSESVMSAGECLQLAEKFGYQTPRSGP